MNSKSIEFDEEKNDSILPEIVRKSFRVPVKDNKNVWVKINGKKYLIVDICLDALGIAIKGNSDFKIDQVLNNCELILFDTTIKGLGGRVVHVPLSQQKKIQYGIQWINIKESDIKKIAKIANKMKEQLLKR